MRIRINQYRNIRNIQQFLVRYHAVADAVNEIPLVDPLKWFGDTHPGGPKTAKLHVLRLYPWAKELQGYNLALAALKILEERYPNILRLDWCVGFSTDTKEIVLFIKPWAAPVGGGRRIWFFIAREDLAALREKLSVAREIELVPRQQALTRER